MSLVIPHYRARQQPVDHRLNMFIAAIAAPVKLKIVSPHRSWLFRRAGGLMVGDQCRPMSRCKFYLEVQANMSNVTVWLPSDFKGHIRYSGRASYSAGFVNRIMQNVWFNQDTLDQDQWDIDEVVVQTKGAVTFRMWDVRANAPENSHKETLKRVFGISKKPEGVRRGINWDFLLDD